jgi:PAS domain S-box-containing protein
MNGAGDSEEIITGMLRESSGAIGGRAAGIALRENDRWLIRYVYNLPEGLVGSHYDDREFPEAAQALRTRKAVIGPHFDSSGEAGSRMQQLLGARSALLFPLLRGEETTGCVFFDYRFSAEACAPIELNFAERSAALVSVAVENARLAGERDRLMGQVSEERARFDAVLEEMPAGVIIAEAPSGRLIRGNEQVERIWRHPFLQAAAAGDYGIYKGFHPGGRPYQPGEWPLLRSLRSGEMVNGEEITILRGDGTEGVISVSSAPIRDIRERIIAGVAIFSDVTDRRLAEEAVRESESKFRNIASAAQDAVILIDNKGTVGFWNDAATKIFGYTSEEMMGKHLHSFIMPERYLDEHIRGFEAFRKTGQGRFIGKTYEIEAKRKDGTEFPVELSLAALKLKDAWNSIGIVRDITARKHAEEELKMTVEELERSNTELQHFAYAASHDLQEPLRTVASFLQLLSRKYAGKLDEKADRYISFAVDGANRMSLLISDLLAYSRTGTAPRQFAAVDMESAARQAIANLKMSMEESKTSIVVGELPVVQGDDSLLVQLLQNLLGNAIKFRKKEEPPRILITARRKGKEWLLGVEDNGIGIDPQYHENIFTLFQRLHTREEYPGTGIGLAICRKIVERHGGRIWVESKPGEGSSFYFTLPAGQAK